MTREPKPIRTGGQRRIPAFSLARIGLCTAILAVSAWISIPLAVPVTLQTCAVYIIAALLGPRNGTVTVLLYIALGAAGLPVFAGFRGGAGTLLGITGGYILGFVFIALIVGLLTRRFGFGAGVLTGSMVLGLLVCYTFGSVWFQWLYTVKTGPIGFGAVLSTCVVPFLIPDAGKIALAVFLTKRLKKAIPA